MIEKNWYSLKREKAIWIRNSGIGSVKSLILSSMISYKATVNSEERVLGITN